MLKAYQQKIDFPVTPETETRTGIYKGYTFVFKDEVCTIKTIGPNGFHYRKPSNPNIDCYMTFDFFKAIQSNKRK